MVWKFNTAAAQEKHAERSGQREPSLTVSPDPSGPADMRVEPSFFAKPQAAAPAALETELFYLPDAADAPVPADTSAFDVAQPKLLDKVEPAMDPQYLFVETQRPEAEDLGIPLLTVQVKPEAEDLGIPLLTVQLEEVPSGDLTWDVPAFEGSVDELPDLRPRPPAPQDHPGLLHRTANNFGHALRFSHDDPRQDLWAEQRRDRGFDDTELWGLDDTFARFILPRLKALRQQKLTPPLRMELAVWYSMLDKMIRAFELLLPEGGGAWDRGALTDKERSQVQEGLDQFRQYYFSLCW
jgi:hypothetical protein